MLSAPPPPTSAPPQVMGGLIGSLIVDPADSYPLPADFAALYGDADSKTMMLNHISFGGDAGGGPFGLKDYA